MKTSKTIFTILTTLVCAGLFFSCGVPVGLGSRLDVDGPLVEFTKVTSAGNETAPPEPRMPVLAEFIIEGTASDFSGVDRLLVKASLNNVDFSKKWQWSKGSWEIFEDGAWRQYPEAEWEGTSREGIWKLPIDMRINGVLDEDKQGQYLFSVQAWDTAEFSDDNSFRTLPLVIDQDPPKVAVSNPYLYPKHAYQFNSTLPGWEFIADPSGVDLDWAEIRRLNGISDNDNYRFEPASIGKFVTQGFLLQWQITDNEDIGKVELRLYPYDIDIDNDPLTTLPNNPIYSYGENVVNLGDIKPNGSVDVPRLDGDPGTYAKGGVLSNPISAKTTIRVVATCYDLAGNPNQEKTIGFFVYWPKADQPWIAFNGAMAGIQPGESIDLNQFYGQEKTTELVNKVFMIYPGRKIKATAYQAHKAHKVTYSLYRLLEDSTYLAAAPNTNPEQWLVEEKVGDETKTVVVPGENGIGECLSDPAKPSTVLPWEFTPPPRSGYYVIRATAYGEKGADDVEPTSTEFESIFRVQDISFPDFYTPVRPAASEPLFQFIGRDNGDGTSTGDNLVPANSIRISGMLSDATNVTSLTMVWINPRSDNYAAMSQLAYFRDQDYHGWKNALTFSTNNNTTNATGEESNGYAPNVPSTGPNRYPYDPSNPNRLWNLQVKPAGEDSGAGTGNTGRRLFSYSVDVDLSQLKIGLGDNDDRLKSQIFLLRVANPDNKCTIITYAPQGDTLSPVLKITNVVIGGVGTPATFLPNKAEQQMEKFAGGEVITVNGTWQEDSVEYLDIGSYFSNNMVVTVNGIELPGVTVNQTNSSDTDGTWTATVTVNNAPGSVLSAADLKDTFVVSATVRDIGGNVAEAGSAWLIQSDTLRLVRISSDEPDGTVNANKTISIFLEFNKSVQLTNSSPSATMPTLHLNTGGTAVYDTTSGKNSGVNTRQYFTYTVANGHSTKNLAEKYLNVDGLNNPGNWENSNYPFIWHRISGETREEIRITDKVIHEATHDGTKPGSHDFYAKNIPVSTSPAATGEYPFTLVAGKNIEIDTAAPQVSSIVANNQPGHYGLNSEIYITVKFNKPVRPGTPTPRLTLDVSTYSTGGTQTATTVQTDPNPDSVRVNGNDITFIYKVAAGNVAIANSEIVVSNYTGSITDLAGTAFANTGISGMSAANRTLNGVYIDTLKPAVPTIRLLSANNTGNVVSNNVSGNTRNGQVSTTDVNLVNVYLNNLWLAIQPSTNNVHETGTGTLTGETVQTLEYSINGGTSWVKAGNIDNIPWALPDQPGQYNIKARQTDRAGNVSAESNVLSFYWDKGNLVSRISSSAANGTYTHVAGRNSVPITVYFRKPVNVTATTGIRLNAQLANNNVVPDVTTVGPLPQNNVSSLTFTYAVANGHKMPAGNNVWLNVDSIRGITARDQGGVDVSSLLTVLPAAGSSLLLNENKQIRVETGNLSNDTPAFIADNQGGTDWNVETSANFHGIRSDDGSYWTTLQIPFNHVISKGAGDITITQLDTNYRLPAVLTETQYNRFRGVANFDTYYTKGTNGYLYTDANNQGSDTTAKYVLNYGINTAAAMSGDLNTFANGANGFRLTERITLSVNSAAVTIDPAINSLGGNTLKIRLSGSSAPQVPGATYTVDIPAGFVTDALGNISAAINPNVALRGAAKPFVRVRKTQDTIATATAGASQPRLVATQPFQTYARIDCRTPNSAITYTAAGTATTATDTNWSVTGDPDDSTAPQTTRPANATSTSYTNGNEITVGDNNNYNGFMWWIRAQATAGGSTSGVAEEVAYRTAITYRLRANNTTGSATAGSNRSILADGDQIWIRGGDAIGSSSIPGFPLTWEDNFTTLAGKRAGIRLMTKVDNTTNIPTGQGNTNNQLNNSTWKFLTWEINATAYIDFIRGSGNEGGTTATSVNVAWQYGPRQAFYQADGWTNFKERFPIYPGKHRWCDAGAMIAATGKGGINFSGTPIQRNAYTANNPNPWTGVNTAAQGN